MNMRQLSAIFVLIFACANALSANDVTPEPDCAEYETKGNSVANVNLNLYKGEQAFAIELLQTLQKEHSEGNVFFSPHSIYHALLLAYFGARGTTAKELADVLYLDWAKEKSLVLNAYHEAKRRRAEYAKTKLELFKSADRIYYDESIQLHACLKTALNDELIKTSFRRDPEASRQEINDFIANITNNEIRELIGEGEIDGRTSAVLTNGAYFKGQWFGKFDKEDTRLQPFYTSATNQSFVDMMHREGHYKYHVDEYLNAHVLEMPFRTTPEHQSNANNANNANNASGANDGNENDVSIESIRNEHTKTRLSMIIVLPTFQANAIEDVLPKLNAASIESALEQAVMREIEVGLPKFEFEEKLNLVQTLKSLGLNSFFGANGNFSAFSAQSDVTFGDASHVAKIKVDEEGSTASAGTFIVTFRSARPIDSTKFICDHPFVFLIYDRSSSSILFTGIYRDPQTRK